MFSSHVPKTEFPSCEDVLSVLNISLLFLKQKCQRGQYEKDGEPFGQGLFKLSVFTLSHKSQHYVITLTTLTASNHLIHTSLTLLEVLPVFPSDCQPRLPRNSLESIFENLKLTT